MSTATLLTALFWISILTLVYVSAGYPVAARLLGGMLRRRVRVAPDREYLPTVTILIAAFNEARYIVETVTNKLELDYPADKLRIFVLNDGSTDGTDEIVDRYAEKGVKHHHVAGRGGKNVAINKTWHLVESEIVVFSDANSIL